MKALILAAGKGTNLYPLTETRPKPMFYICGKPVLEYIVRALAQTGDTDIIMIVGHYSEMIKRYFGSGERFGVNIQYIEQEQQTGIGDAVLLAEKKFTPGEPFFLAYADILFESNIFAETKATFSSKLAPVAAITLTSRIHPYCGNVAINQDSMITKIGQPEDTRAGDFLLAGVFVFDYTLFATLREANGDMQTALERFVQQRALFSSIFEKEWVDLGYPWNILDANRFLMNAYKYATNASNVTFKGNVWIDGPVQLDEGVTVCGGAILNGPCYIGKGTFIGNNVLVRSNTSIGANCIIGYGVELKNCVLFDNVKIGRLSFVGDSVLGEGVEFGSGIMTVNNLMTDETINVDINGKAVDSKLIKLGAFIGDQAKIGVSNTLAPGTLVPAGHFVSHRFSGSSK